ncbi:hypothetical protein ACLB2K_000194 [Fragaria x ananassa]
MIFLLMIILVASPSPSSCARLTGFPTTTTLRDDDSIGVYGDQVATVTSNSFNNKKYGDVFATPYRFHEYRPLSSSQTSDDLQAFPEADGTSTFNVMNYGAIGNDQFDSTQKNLGFKLKVAGGRISTIPGLQDQLENNDLSPIWNEHFDFVAEDESAQHLVVKVFDDDWGIRLIGRALVQLSELQPALWHLILLASFKKITYGANSGLAQDISMLCGSLISTLERLEILGEYWAYTQYECDIECTLETEFSYIEKLHSIRYAKNIIFEHITIQEAKNPIIIDQKYSDDSTAGFGTLGDQGSAVQVSDVTFCDFHGSVAGDIAITLDCDDHIGCENIVMDHIDLTSSVPGKNVCCRMQERPRIFYFIIS